MGKADREKRKRQRTLKRLAENKPKCFTKQWNLRILSFCGEIRKVAGKTIINDEDKFHSVSDVVEYALSELRLSGDVAFEIAAERTEDILTEVCSKVVDSFVDRITLRLVGDYARIEREQLRGLKGL